MLDHLRPDLVLLDTSVANIMIMERCRHDVPIVVFTSGVAADDRQGLFGIAASEVVRKPTNLDSYVRVVSEIVRKWGRSDNTIDHASGA